EPKVFFGQIGGHKRQLLPEGHETTAGTLGEFLKFHNLMEHLRFAELCRDILGDEKGPLPAITEASHQARKILIYIP
ncbi:MAG: hypothetical protein U0944_00400, partial [Candidatus Moranbacteria bacterium]|nr:hypothetical protein [Candidatus Moranbacteria bacterium]